MKRYEIYARYNSDWTGGVRLEEKATSLVAAKKTADHLKKFYEKQGHKGVKSYVVDTKTEQKVYTA